MADITPTEISVPWIFQKGIEGGNKMYNSYTKAKKIAVFIISFLLMFISFYITIYIPFSILISSFPTLYPAFLKNFLMVYIVCCNIIYHPLLMLPRIGLKKYKTILSEDISQKREIICGGYITNCRRVKSFFLNDAFPIGLLFFTEVGIEYYIGPYALKKRRSFYIPWDEIESISISNKQTLSVKVHENKIHKFLFLKEDWFYFEDTKLELIKEKLKEIQNSTQTDFENY